MNDQITAKELIDMVVECRYTSHLAQLFKEKLASAPPDTPLDTPTMREIRSYSESKGLTFREGFNAFFAEIYATNGNILKNVTDKMFTLLEECLKAGENKTEPEGTIDEELLRLLQQFKKLTERRASIQDNAEEKALDQQLERLQERIRLMRMSIFLRKAADDGSSARSKPVAKDKRRRATTIGIMAASAIIMIAAIVMAICALVVPGAAKMLTAIACAFNVLAIIVAIAMVAYEKKQDKANKNK